MPYFIPLHSPIYAPMSIFEFAILQIHPITMANFRLQNVFTILKFLHLMLIQNHDIAFAPLYHLQIYLHINQIHQIHRHRYRYICSTPIPICSQSLRIYPTNTDTTRIQIPLDIQTQLKSRVGFKGAHVPCILILHIHFSQQAKKRYWSTVLMRPRDMIMVDQSPSSKTCLILLYY